MKRTVIEIRELDGRIQVRHPRHETWHDSALSPAMRLDDLSIPDVKSLLDSYLDEDYLRNGVWDMRIAAQKKIGAALKIDVSVRYVWRNCTSSAFSCAMESTT